eukprot:NODE_56_length_25944_cov_0.235287.p3 type:complete len:769 gc:universal NODE_56_length_25944_cov_0.235287:19390-21696(+)
MIYSTKQSSWLVIFSNTFSMTLCDVTFSLSNQLNQLYSISIKSHLLDEVSVIISANDVPLSDPVLFLLDLSWQIIEFPILISEIPSNAILTFTMLNKSISCNVFNDAHLLRNGIHSINFGNKNFPTLLTLESKLRQYERGELSKDALLDTVMLASIQSEIDSLYKLDLFVVIQYPLFKFPVVYNEEFPILDDNQHFNSWYDPQVHLLNIIEEKHRRLIRDTRSGYVDIELKPSLQTRDEINRIIAMSCTSKLSSDERDLIWTFRYYLSKSSKACTRFIASVYWNDVFERAEAIKLLSKWDEISIEDSLELLSEHSDEYIRQFATNRILKCTNREIELYLIQLVQAVKYETIGYSDRFSIRLMTSEMDLEILSTSPLLDCLFNKCINIDLIIPFYWHIRCESELVKHGLLFSLIQQYYFKLLKQEYKDVIRRQSDLVKYLNTLSGSLKLSKEPRLRKIEWLQEALADPKNGLNVFPPMTWLLQPSLTVIGILPTKTNLFKSALQPLLLTFTCDDGLYTCIFKTGDDMRQDQLCLQLIELMDQFMLKDNLDLKIKTYKVISVGEKVGFAEFIDSKPLSVILDEHHGVLFPYLLGENESSISSDVMDTYLRSSAGYCVMTFILGVGDRHLDNVLLTKQGKLFHVDYAYILGLDPKPYPPYMKICKEMVELMGGLQHPNYSKFKQYCFTAYSILRKHSKSIIQLLMLMKEANMPSIQQDPDTSINKLLDKFRLDLNEKEAIEYFDQLITESATALFPQVLETIHRFAQYWRR